MPLRIVQGAFNFKRFRKARNKQNWQRRINVTATVRDELRRGSIEIKSGAGHMSSM